MTDDAAIHLAPSNKSMYWKPSAVIGFVVLAGVGLSPIGPTVGFSVYSVPTFFPAYFTVLVES